MTDNRRLLTTSLGVFTRRRRLIALVLGAVVILGVAAVMLAPAPQKQDRRARRGGGAGDGPVPVLAVPAKKADVPVYLEGVGTARALNTVTVRAQVEGKLISVAFKEGQDVKKGQILALIDPTTYQAQLDQAVAKKAQDEALLANARIDLERYTRLAASNSITKQQADTQRSTVAQMEAQVQVDQGAVDNARAILAYTTITAPINGRTGIRQVDEGNIVRGSDATGIVVLTEIQPISVIFNLPQQVVAQVNAAFAKGPLAGRGARRRQRSRDRSRHLAGGGQPGGSDHRHGEAESGVSQRQPAALVGAVRQCAHADRYPAAGRGRARPLPSSADRTGPSSLPCRANGRRAAGHGGAAG